MFTGEMGVEWGRVVFVVCFGVAGVVLVAIWIWDRLSGRSVEPPAEVPVVGDAVAIPYVENKKLRAEYNPEEEFDIQAKNATDDFMTDPAYSFLVGNLYHHDD